MEKYIYDESNGLWYELQENYNQQAEQMFHRQIFSLSSIYFANVVDFYIVLRYIDCIEVQCIALKLMGGMQNGSAY